MKKLIAITLTLVLILTCLPLSAAAKEASIEQKFRLLIEDMELDPAYSADRYLYEEKAQYPAKDPEWVLIRAELIPENSPGTATGWDGLFGNKIVLSQPYKCVPFALGYGVFDIKSNTFYDLIDAWDMGFDSLHEVWNGLDGDGTMKLIGDADGDGTLSIFDATRIQRVLAGLETEPHTLYEKLRPDMFLHGYPIGGACDYDRDGSLTILDATKIQRNLADLPNILETKLAFDLRTISSDDVYNNTARVITSVKELDDFYRAYGQNVNNSGGFVSRDDIAGYTDAYFKDKMLIGCYVCLASGSWSLSYQGAKIDNDGTLEVSFMINGGNTGTGDINERFILIEASKAFADDIRSADITLTVDDSIKIVDTFEYGKGITRPADPTREGYRVIASVREFSSMDNPDDTLIPSSAYCELTGHNVGDGYYGFIAVIENVSQLTYLFPDLSAMGYSDGYFNTYALVAAVCVLDSNVDGLELSNLAVKGNTLYGEVKQINHQATEPAYRIVYDVHQVKKSALSSVTHTAIWVSSQAEPSVIAEIPLDSQITATAPNNLNSGGFREVAGEALTFSSPNKYDYYFSGPLNDVDTGYLILIRSRNDFEYYLPEFDKEGTLDDAFFKDNAVLAMLQHGGADEAYAVLSDIAVKDDGTLWCSPQICINYYYDDNGTPYYSPSDPVVCTFLSVKQSEVKDVKTIEFWKGRQRTYYETLITDDKKVAEGTYGDRMSYTGLPTATRVFTWDYQKYGDGKDFLNQPYRVAIIRSYAQYETFFSSVNFEGIAEYSTKPIWQTVNGNQYPLDEVFFQNNALIIGVGYFCIGEEYLNFDEIQQSADGKTLTVRFNRYTYGDLHPNEPYAANILGYCFAAASVPKDSVKGITNVNMLPQVKKLPNDIYTPMEYEVLDSQDDLCSLDTFSKGFIETDEAVYIDSADKLKSSIDSLLVDYSGNPYDRGEMRFPVENDAIYGEAWFETHDMIAVRVYRGGSSTRQYVTDLERSAAGDLLLEVTLMHNGYDTPDNAWSLIFLGVEKQEGDPAVTVVTVHEDNLPEPEKPILYLYPEVETELTVTLGKPEELTCTYPAYNNGWHVTARPDGTLIDDSGRSYYSLYWESRSHTAVSMTDGFVVSGKDTARFFEEKLALLGLNEREAQEFIVYWLPKMQNNKYNLIRFATREEIEQIMPLSFSVQPDTVIRVLMQYKPLDAPINVPEQKFTTPTPERKGFVAVEWGGMLVK